MSERKAVYDRDRTHVERHCMERGEEGVGNSSTGTTKVEVMRGLLAIDGKARWVDVNCKSQRRILAKLRGGTAALRMETGRWGGLKREERLCKQCRLEEVEDEEHFLLRCEGWTQEREVMTEYVEMQVGATDDRKVALILDQACCDGRVGRAVEKMWQS